MGKNIIIISKIQKYHFKMIPDQTVFEKKLIFLSKLSNKSDQIIHKTI